MQAKLATVWDHFDRTKKSTGTDRTVLRLAGPLFVYFIDQHRDNFTFTLPLPSHL